MQLGSNAMTKTNDQNKQGQVVVDREKLTRVPHANEALDVNRALRSHGGRGACSCNRDLLRGGHSGNLLVLWGTRH